MARQLSAELFDRIATSLEQGKIPTVEDSVAFECLLIQYWEKEEGLALVSRITNSGADITKLNKCDIQSIANHLVHQKTPENRELFLSFARLLRCYLEGTITAADLLGERDRKPRNGQSWQCKDQYGEKAEQIHILVNEYYKQLGEKPSLQTGNRSISNGLNVNLYNLLSELSNPLSDIDNIKKKYKLHADLDIASIDTGFISPSRWRDYHLEFKKFS